MTTDTPAGPVRWGFLGTGKMAGALIGGMIRAGVARPGDILASDSLPAARQVAADAFGIDVTADNRLVARRSDVVVLAVKPQAMAALLAEVRPEMTGRHLVVSVAAGVSLATMAGGLGTACRLARVMPNTPAMVGEGAAGYCLGPNATDSDDALVRSCLGAVGRAFRVPEPLLDAVTGLAGSGPAFVYLVIDALSDGGVKAGLPRDVATSLAAQTVLGAAKMVLETGLHPGALKDQVTSPGGTTIAGLHALEKGGVRAAMIDAVEAASRRSAELAELAARGPGPGGDRSRAVPE